MSRPISSAYMLYSWEAVENKKPIQQENHISAIRLPSSNIKEGRIKIVVRFKRKGGPLMPVNATSKNAIPLGVLGYQERVGSLTKYIRNKEATACVYFSQKG